MDASPTVLGLDIGTSAIKAAVLDLAGDGLATASVPTPFRSRPAGVEMSVADLFAEREVKIAVETAENADLGGRHRRCRRSW